MAWTAAPSSYEFAIMSSRRLLSIVGILLGECVLGDGDGNGVGIVVGDWVGRAVGDLVGNRVGDFVGNLVGDFVGDLVGDFVGNLVGFGVAGTGAKDGVCGLFGASVGDPTGPAVGEAAFSSFLLATATPMAVRMPIRIIKQRQHRQKKRHVITLRSGVTPAYVDLSSSE